MTSSVASAARPAPARWPWVLVALAWTTALVAAVTGHAYVLDHAWALEATALPAWARFAAFLAAWQVMTVATMLPSSVPLVRFVAHAARHDAGARAVAVNAAFLGAYALIWTAFASVAVVLDAFVHLAAARSAWLAAHPGAIAAATLAAGGAFQFTSWKHACLRACRAPFPFFVKHYRRGVAGAWRLGVRHGLFCLGCCWALMLVMFGVGVGSVAWMAALAGAGVIERRARFGAAFARALGAIMLVAAAAIAWRA